MTNQHNTSGREIDREEWVEAFEEGAKNGAAERKRVPEERRRDVTDVLDTVDRTGPEIEALQEGYELGMHEMYPGADVDVQDRANAAYDRSDYSAGLSQWGA